MPRLPFLYVTALLLAATLAPSQSPPPPISTLRVEPIGVERLREFRLTFRNDSPKPIIGYVALIKLLANGRQIDNFEHLYLSHHPGLEQKGPNATWTVTLRGVASDSANTPADTLQVTFDSVLFADRKAWGPDQTRFSFMLRGELDGSRWERRRLRAILNERGTAALLEDLRRDEPNR